jgi:hypothetical protein
MATSALALAGAMAAGPASAADMLAIGVGGYMEQWVGFANRDDSGVDGGFDVQTDAEVHFKGSLESDSGLKFTVHVELEAANDSVSGLGADGDKKTDETEIDEAFVRVSGAFGDIEIGQRDPIHARMHYATGDAGVGLNAGDTGNWIPGAYLETAGWTIPGDNRNIIYITPRVNGVQVGLSYGADAGSENSTTSAPDNNDDAVWAAGINFNETIGDMSFKVSLGHLNRSQSAGAMVDIDGDDDSKDFTLSAMDKSGDNMMKGHDDQTFTNAGVRIGMGAFTFGASYATRDNGGHESKCYATVAIDAADLVPAGEETPLMKAQDEAAVGATIPCGHRNARFADQNIIGQDGDETLVADNAVNARHMFVEDESGQSDTWAVGIGYTDGPLSLSVGHVSYEQEDGDERTATMVSAGYKLAPGVAWKTSIFGVEDDTKDTEGTAFVTGLRIDF